ncbi:hypothetical protein PN498_13980 [Oscillatoria sp. CS-180]|uniref:hypothetical protein n=1 Tax=Oscillatoria sp. CS-180 TaxID=3021720 RepID=UPI002330F222|nr:hypothetical protein [Oscillatoria sp. CS-180]MDB9527106.1 hypothetical protein [Oscillatoria sp. CS-180]
MVTKTNRILSYLPSTFRTQPAATVLKQLIDTFGQDLLAADNSLAEILAAHFVDYADRAVMRVGDRILPAEIDDLAKIAALYGLAPRREADLSGRELAPGEDRGDIIESVEAFRARLKRYVRTFLEGTVTIQGILRVAAEALVLEIADAPEELEGWWQRSQPLLTTTPHCEDATAAVFGAHTTVTGQAAQAAQIIGQVVLGSTLDLQGAHQLYLEVNGEAQTINLSQGESSDEVAVSAIIDILNAAFGDANIARLQDGVLVLTAPGFGPSSRLVVAEGTNDAATALLGLDPYDYRGSEAQPAQVIGEIALPAMMDLSAQRYLRLELDRTQTVEIDCANPAAPDQTTPEQVQAAINQMVGTEVATLDEGRLVLTSPTVGFNSSIALQRPSAQEATDILLGTTERFFLGQEAQPARILSRQDLSSGVDLSDQSQIRFRVNGGSSLMVDCAGEDPANTQLFEIVTAINTDTGRNLARQDGQFLSLVSPTVGNNSRLTLEPLPEGDAIAALFGFPPRTITGAGALPARLISVPDVAALMDTQAPRSLFLGQLKLAIDGSAATKIPVRIELLDLTGTDASAYREPILNALTAAINQVYPDLASHDGERLMLTSTTVGSASRIELLPIETTQERPFVTRVAILNDAVRSLFGRPRLEASGTAATAARLVGMVDLSRGKDLSTDRHIRIQVDEHSAWDIDCAGLRPRVTLLSDVVAAINAVSQQAINADIASAAGRFLLLTSPTTGAHSRLVLEPSQATNALPALALPATTTRGQDATSVTVVGTVALSDGIDLPAGAALRIQVDQMESVTVTLTPEAARLNLDEILLTINQQLARVVAQTDGQHLVLTSATMGTESVIALDIPETGIDVTADLLGFAAPRSYQGQAAQAAKVSSQSDLPSTLELSARHIVDIAVDNQPTRTVDLTQGISDASAVPPATVAIALNQAFEGTEIATVVNDRLVLRSPTTGLNSRLVLTPHSGADATALLFGESDRQAQGSDPAPAVLVGEADLTTSIDLTQGSQLRLQVDDQSPVDIEVVGATPTNTFGDEVMAAINAVYPELAALTPTGQLQLTSPTAGETSRLAVFPQRYLELVEYVPTPAIAPSQSVRHGDRWSLLNGSVTESTATVEIHAPQGTVGPALVNMTSGWQIRVLSLVDAGETLILQAQGDHLHARIRSVAGEERSVSSDKLLVGPIGTQVLVPFTGAYPFRLDGQQQTALQLNTPQASHILRLKAASQFAADLTITVKPHELSDAIALPAPGDAIRLSGRLQLSPVPRLVDGEGNDLIHLRPHADLELASYDTQVVTVVGSLYGDQPPLLEVHQIHALFDVKVYYPPENPNAAVEEYFQVTIGADDEQSLSQQVNARSQRLTAELLPKSGGLRLPLGPSHWQYLDCYSSRFNQADFNQAYFAGDRCRERGIFNVSRFVHEPPELVEAVFTGEISVEPPVLVHFSWLSHQPGSFEVHLPADLPPRFGGRFNEARFSQSVGQPERYSDAVLETTGNTNFDAAHSLVPRVNQGTQQSTIVKAQIVDRVPLGWAAVEVPFRRPQVLTLGSRDAAARIYLKDPDVANQFVLLEAKAVGVWGNEIAVSARPAGQGMYEVAIAYQASRFENARQVVLGNPLPASTQDLLEPSPIGILQAKAAGVKATVTRDTCHP